MKTQFPKTLTPPLSFQFSRQVFLFHFPSRSRKNPTFLYLPHRKRRCTPKTLTFCSATASGSLTYRGWDDLRPIGDSVHFGESNQLRNFLNCLGIDDKKYIFVYLLGFVCALAISRVRVSSIVVIPACVIVFAVGFSVGFVNGGHMTELGSNGTKKRLKDENFRGSVEKLRNLVDVFYGLDAKISNLKNEIKRGIGCNEITVGDLESYTKVMDSIGISALNAKNIVETYIDSILADNQEMERTLNQKASRRRKEVGETGFDLLQFVTSVFQENSVSSKPNRMKDLIKRDSRDVEVNDRTQRNILAPKIEERILNSVSNGNAGFHGDILNNLARVQDEAKELVDRAQRINLTSENGKMDLVDMDNPAKRVSDCKEYSYWNSRLQFMNNQQVSLKMDHRNEVETWTSQDGLLDSADFSVSLKHMKTEASFGPEQTYKKLNGNHRPSDRMEKSEKETYRSHIREERVIPDHDSSLATDQFEHASDYASSPSSMVSDDMVFNSYLMEANVLLKEARECLTNRGDEGHAEVALYESARLLSEAINMKPMSLLAVGQLGNTYLLHGELKLKISHELRALLARSDPVSVDRWGRVLKGIDLRDASKDKITSILVNVCEECEELLVKAGRKYRLALSIDGNDMRALYNWGLALSFRAQLIADIGPEAAIDADKVFLAAIDKFDAMMSKSNVYAPDALFRWGAALQQRSRLRPRNSKEKLKLLQQARRLYEDALHMDMDNLQVREALSSCISELNYRNY